MERKKLTQEQKDAWNNKNQPFKKTAEGYYIVPNIPVCDAEDYNTIVVPALIRCGAIPKDKLVAGKTYLGECRNASEAEWNGENFIYQRYEWGQWYPEKINHFQDDNGYDLFVPVEEKA